MRVEPHGPHQDDLRAGIVTSFVAASSGATVAPADVFPSLRVPTPKPTAADEQKWARGVLAVVRALTRSEGGVVVGEAVAAGSRT